MKLVVKELPRVVFAVGVIGAVIVLVTQGNGNPFIITPTLCILWCFASLLVMGPLHSLKRSQVIVAILAIGMAVGISVYYKLVIPQDAVGRIGLLTLFACFVVQALLRRRGNSPS